MRIGIIGAGNVGKALERAWTAKGHQIKFGRKDNNQEAAAFGEVVVLSVPWPAAQQAIASAGNLAGKTLIDCTNPLAPDLSGLVVGLNSSAGEQVAAWAKGASVVKAFNTIGAAIMGNADFNAVAADGFYCGDDAAAKAKAKTLIADAGFNPVDVGPLKNARLLEPLAMLWIDLAVNQGWRVTHAFKLLRR